MFGFVSGKEKNDKYMSCTGIWVTAIAKAGRTFLEKQLSFSGVLCARGRVLWSKAKEALELSQH